VLAAARVADEVVVLTRANNASTLRDSDVPSNVTFEFYDIQRIAKFKRLVPYGTQLYYVLWQLFARRVVARLLAQTSFDLTHHVTFAVDWMPVATLSRDVPHIWGPVGGATGLPWKLWRGQGLRGLAREAAREIVTKPFRALWGRSIARRSTLTIAQNLDVERALEKYAPHISVRPNVVIDPHEGHDEDLSDVPWPGCDKVALFVGRLIPHKGLRYAIEALAKPSSEGWGLLVVGDGPERETCLALAQELGLENRVSFYGAVSHERAVALMRSVDALIAPSMYEGSGFAVAEAVTHGCPVVGTSRGGIQVMVPPGAGALVRADRDLAQSLSTALAGIGERRQASSLWSLEALVEYLSRQYGLVCDRAEQQQ
jgi:glycosyltransferase involved in cell wall biosynthesis